MREALVVSKPSNSALPSLASGDGGEKRRRPGTTGAALLSPPKECEAIHHRQTASENILNFLSFAALAFLLLFPFKILFKAITPKTLILRCPVAHSLC